MPDFIRRHKKILLAIACSVVLFLAIPIESFPLRAALAWDGGACFFIAHVLITMLHADAKEMRKHAQKLDVRGYLLFGIMIIAAFLSLSLSLSLWHEVKTESGFLHYAGFGLAIFTVVISWFFVQVIFTVHYAHHYYSHDKVDDEENEGGLDFPQATACGEKPDFWDFLYFSFVLGMTFQVSDVQVTRHHMRKRVLAHGIIAFFFNTFIFALSVNIAASVFG